MCVCAQSLQSCLTRCDPMDCSPPGSLVHGILQARILEWVAIPSSRRLSQSRDRTPVSCVSCIAGNFFYHWATREAPPGKYCILNLYAIIQLPNLYSKYWQLQGGIYKSTVIMREFNILLLVTDGKNIQKCNKDIEHLNYTVKKII